MVYTILYHPCIEKNVAGLLLLYQHYILGIMILHYGNAYESTSIFFDICCWLGGMERPESIQSYAW